MLINLHFRLCIEICIKKLFMFLNVVFNCWWSLLIVRGTTWIFDNSNHFKTHCCISTENNPPTFPRELPVSSPPVKCFLFSFNSSDISEGSQSKMSNKAFWMHTSISQEAFGSLLRWCYLCWIVIYQSTSTIDWAEPHQIN